MLFDVVRIAASGPGNPRSAADIERNDGKAATCICVKRTLTF